MFRDVDTRRILSGISARQIAGRMAVRRGIIDAVWAEYARQVLESSHFEMELSADTQEIAQAIRAVTPETVACALSGGTAYLLSVSGSDVSMVLDGDDAEGIYLAIGSERIDISELGPENAALFIRDLFKAYGAVRKKCWASIC